MRLIDADALLELVQFRSPINNRNAEVIARCVDVTRGLIEAQPTIDAVEVVHGRWEECDWVEYDGHGECVHYPNAGCVCTNCRNAFKKEFINNPRVDYCPHCGAKNGW